MTEQIHIDRRSGSDRRKGTDRRQVNLPVAHDRRQGERRKAPRRRQIDPTTCERDYTADEIEFMRAMDEYKRRSGRMFPTCSEILEVIRSLGYTKIRVEQSGEKASAGASPPQENAAQPTVAQSNTP